MRPIHRLLIITACVSMALGAVACSRGTSTDARPPVSQPDAKKPAAVDTTQPPAVPATESVPPTKTPEAEPTKAERNFAFIREVKTSGGGYSLVADYAQFLTGDAAAKAAAAAGEESPPPNDFFIVNQNERLRTLPVAANARVSIVTADSQWDGTDGPRSWRIAKFAAEWRNTAATGYRLKDVPYWVTVKNGVVTKIEEQYLP